MNESQSDFILTVQSFQVIHLTGIWFPFFNPCNSLCFHFFPVFVIHTHRSGFPVTSIHLLERELMSIDIHLLKGFILNIYIFQLYQKKFWTTKDGREKERGVGEKEKNGKKDAWRKG